MEMIGFRATKEMLAKLKEIALKERRPLSNLVRMIVEDWLEDHYGDEVQAVKEKPPKYKSDKE